MTGKSPHVEWKNAPNSVRILKPNGESIDINVGDFINIKESFSN